MVEFTLALADPDSSAVPASAPKDAGDYLLDSQAGQKLIFDRFTGSHQRPPPRPTRTRRAGGPVPEPDTRVTILLT